MLVAEPRHGERLDLSGEWKRSEFSGEDEFHFRSAAPCIPDDPYAMLQYAAEVTKGIGPARLDEIWRAYGKDWSTHPDLDGIDGMSASTRMYWSDTIKRLQHDKAHTTAMSFMIGHGCSMTVASKAWEKWAENCIQTITDNPYSLADLPYCGFATVDGDMRRLFGIGDTDPRRIDAAIIYKLNDLAQQQGTLVSETTLASSAADLITDAPQLIPDAIDRLVKAEKIVRLHDGIALVDDYQNEQAIMDWIRVAA